MLTSQLMGSPANVQDGIALANAIIDTVRDPLVVLDQKLRVITASRSFYNTFRLTRDDVHGLCSMRSTVVNGTSQSFESY
jgi:PAS domain-containing protein